MALMTLMDRWNTSLETDKLVMGIFLDFSKAFDTVDHVILWYQGQILEMFFFRVI